ncbi:MAG: hypothetical protein ACREUT_17165 [Steroidobacteraceae bacterium]
MPRWTLLCTLLIIVATAGTSTVRAQTVEASIDLRLVDSKATRSYLEGGLGTLRYGDQQFGIQLGRARLALTLPIGQVLELKLDGSSWGDSDRNPFDLTEAYLEFRPYPFAGLRARIRAGAFFPPTTLENTASGWDSPYTISSSALDTWVGEELRTIGAQGQLEWLGTRLGHDFDVGLVAAVFGWNDPAGVALANQGFAIDDRQTNLFGRVGEPGARPVSGVQLFHEIDGRAGVYGGISVRYLDRLSMIALHYDNRGDPSALDTTLGEHAWHTRFTTAGVRVEPSDGWIVIAQWMQGETYIAPTDLSELEWGFDTRYFLVSRRFGRQMATVRYDGFTVSPEAPTIRGNQNGHALTLTYGFEPTASWRMMLEWVRVRSGQSNRLIYFGQDPFATDSALQLSVRYSFESG